MEVWSFSCSFFGLLVNSFAIGLTTFFKLLICEEKTYICCIKMSLNILRYFFFLLVFIVSLFLCNLYLFVLIYFVFILLFGFSKKNCFISCLFVFSVSIDVVFICCYGQLDVIICVMKIQNCINEWN
jgi:hypothetical protein